MSKKNGTAPCSDPKGVFPFNCSVDLTQWRKRSEQALNCSRKWRNTEDPPQELHSSLKPFSAKASGPDGTLGFLCLVWGRCPPAMYDVCYSQAGGKAVSARWVCCGWHEQRRRQAQPITRGARGLLLVWVVVAEPNGSISLKFRHILLNILSTVEWSQPCTINSASSRSVNLCFEHIYVLVSWAAVLCTDRYWFSCYFCQHFCVHLCIFL